CLQGQPAAAGFQRAASRLVTGWAETTDLLIGHTVEYPGHAASSCISVMVNPCYPRSTPAPAAGRAAPPRPATERIGPRRADRATPRPEAPRREPGERLARQKTPRLRFGLVAPARGCRSRTPRAPGVCRACYAAARPALRPGGAILLRRVRSESAESASGAAPSPV